MLNMKPKLKSLLSPVSLLNAFISPHHRLTSRDVSGVHSFVICAHSEAGIFLGRETTLMAHLWQGLLFGERLTTMGRGLTAVENTLSPHAPGHEESASSVIKGGINPATVRDFCHQKSHPGQQ